MYPLIDTQQAVAKLLETPRPGEDKVLAFYEHRFGAICKNPRLMLLPLDDHLVHRGDGVFETLKYEQGRIYQLQPHVDRMRRSSESIYLTAPCPWEEVVEILKAVARAGGQERGMLRVLLGRGPGGFGIDPSECPVPSLYVTAYQYTPKPESVFEKGVKAIRTAIPAKQSYLAKIKSIDYLPNVLMKREAASRGADFPVCFDEFNYMAEGATENMAIVDEKGRMVVPELTNALTGTTLMRAIELAGNEIAITHGKISEEDIYRAKEFFILGTTADALSIVNFNDRPIADGKPGPVARLLRAKLKADLLENGTPF